MNCLSQLYILPDKIYGSGCLPLRVWIWTPWAFKSRLYQGGELLAKVTIVFPLIRTLRGSWAKQGQVQRMCTNVGGALLRAGSWCTMLTCYAPMLRFGPCQETVIWLYGAQRTSSVSQDQLWFPFLVKIGSSFFEGLGSRFKWGILNDF